VCVCVCDCGGGDDDDDMRRLVEMTFKILT
jgi:hypothetical protein